jgi:putative colanic acid biosynthesis acetyltransferase WcaF
MVKPGAAPDPHLQAMTSLRSRIGRAVWGVVYLLLFRPSPRPAHAWRAWLLRCFGAQLGPHCHIYAGARIWAPWNLRCADVVAIADGAEIYNEALISIGSHATISQQAYLCSASHDAHDPAFPLIAAPITIGARAWICARATVMPGVTVGEGAVLALGAVATHNLDAWSVYGGLPARKLSERQGKP